MASTNDSLAPNVLVSDLPRDGQIKITAASEFPGNVWYRITDLCKSDLVEAKELQRVKNMVEMDIASGYTGVMNKAESLAMAEMLEGADLVNTEIDRYLNVSETDILNAAKEFLADEKSSTLYYGKD